MKSSIARRPAELVAPSTAQSTDQQTTYRYVVFGRAAGPWRASRQEALLDAIYAGDGSRDEHSGIVYLGPLSEIESMPEDGARHCYSWDAWKLHYRRRYPDWF